MNACAHCYAYYRHKALNNNASTYSAYAFFAKAAFTYKCIMAGWETP